MRLANATDLISGLDGSNSNTEIYLPGALSAGLSPQNQCAVLARPRVTPSRRSWPWSACRARSGNVPPN